MDGESLGLRRKSAEEERNVERRVDQVLILREKLLGRVELCLESRAVSFEGALDLAEEVDVRINGGDCSIRVGQALLTSLKVAFTGFDGPVGVFNSLVQSSPVTDLSKTEGEDVSGDLFPSPSAPGA